MFFLPNFQFVNFGWMEKATVKRYSGQKQQKKNLIDRIGHKRDTFRILQNLEFMARIFFSIQRYSIAMKNHCLITPARSTQPYCWKPNPPPMVYLCSAGSTNLCIEKVSIGGKICTMMTIS